MGNIILNLNKTSPINHYKQFIMYVTYNPQKNTNIILFDRNKRPQDREIQFPTSKESGTVRTLVLTFEKHQDNSWRMYNRKTGFVSTEKYIQTFHAGQGLEKKHDQHACFSINSDDTKLTLEFEFGKPSKHIELTELDHY